MAARPRGADSKTGHQAGGGSCRTGASQKGLFRSGKLRKRASGGLPVAPQPNKPRPHPCPNREDLLWVFQYFKPPYVWLGYLGPEPHLPWDPLSHFCLRWVLKRMKRDVRVGESRAQPGGLRPCWVVSAFASPSFWRDQGGQRRASEGWALRILRQFKWK